MKYLLFTAYLLLLVGCYGPKTAFKQVDRAIREEPTQTAGQLRKEWPCDTTSVIIKRDTIDNREDVEIYRETINGLEEDLSESSSLVDTLIKQLGSGDTACRRYLAVIVGLQRQILDLKQKVITLPAPPPQIIRETKEITVLDSAATREAYGKRDEAVTLAAKQTTRADKWEALAKRRWWITLGEAVVIFMLLYLLFKRKK